MTPLVMAIAGGFPQTATYLAEKGADPTIIVQNGFNVFHMCVEIGYVPTLKAMLKARQDLVSGRTDVGATPLDIAILSENEDVVNLLKENGACRSTKCNDSGYLLTISKNYGSYQCS